MCVLKKKHLNFAFKCTLKKKVFLKLFKITFQKNFFLKYILGQIKIFFKNLRPLFQNSFVPRFFMFSVLSFRMEHKKLLKTEHQCTFFYIMNFTSCCPFWGIFAALRPSFYYFYIFFRGSEVCLEICDSYSNFSYWKKIKYFHSKRIL